MLVDFSTGYVLCRSGCADGTLPSLQLSTAAARWTCENRHSTGCNVCHTHVGATPVEGNMLKA